MIPKAKIPYHFIDSARDLLERRKIRNALIALAVVFLAWTLGKAIATHNFDIPLSLAGLGFLVIIFFRPQALIVATPFAFCVPNFGLDIPGPWAVTIEDAYIMLIFGAMLSGSILYRRPIARFDTPITRPLLALWAVAMVSIIKTAAISPQNLILIVKELMRLTLMLMLFFSLLNIIQTKQQINRIIKWLLILSVPMALVSWYIYLTGSPFFYYILTMKPAYIFYKRNFLRMISIAGSTSFTGLYYALMIALAWTWPGFNKGRHWRVIRVLLIALLTSCLLATLNRGTWVGVFLGVMVMMFTGKLNRKKIALATVIFLGMAFLMTFQFFSQFDVEAKANIVVELSRSTGAARLTRWLSSLNVIAKEPILGVGYNNYAFVYGNYSIQEGLIRVYGSPHNMYVDILSGLGLLGFTCFLIFIYRLIKMFSANLKTSEDSDLKTISTGLFIALIFYFGASAFDSFLFKPHHTSFIIVILWALAAAIYKINEASGALSKEKN